MGIILLFTYDKKAVSLLDGGPKLKPFILTGNKEEIDKTLKSNLGWKDPIKNVGHYLLGNKKVNIYASISTFIDCTIKNTIYPELELFDITEYYDDIEPTLMVSIELALGNIHFDMNDN